MNARGSDAGELVADGRVVSGRAAVFVALTPVPIVDDTREAVNWSSWHYIVISGIALRPELDLGRLTVRKSRRFSSNCRSWVKETLDAFSRST